MNEENKKTVSQQTICWDCSKAVSGCSWSRYFKPVKGWKIIPIKKEVYGGAAYKSCIVLECPEFKRDAYKGGLKRVRKDDFYDTVSKNT